MYISLYIWKVKIMVSLPYRYQSSEDWIENATPPENYSPILPTSRSIQDFFQNLPLTCRLKQVIILINTVYMTGHTQII